MLQNKFKQKNYVILTIEYQYYTHLNIFVVSYKNPAPHSFIWEFISKKDSFSDKLLLDATVYTVHHVNASV